MCVLWRSQKGQHNYLQCGFRRRYCGRAGCARTDLLAVCGEEWIDAKTAGILEEIANEAKKRRHQVEVLAF